MEFIDANNLIIVPSLFAIGYALKQAKCINDNYIPLLLLGCGAILGLFSGFTVHNALEGLICGAVSMGLYDTTKPLRGYKDLWNKKK